MGLGCLSGSKVMPSGPRVVPNGPKVSKWA